VLINIAQTYEKTGRYDSSIFYNTQAITLCQSPGFESELASAYGNIGLVFKRMGNFDMALDNYKKAYDISISLNVPEMIATDLNNIAAIYLHWENFDLANDYFHKALDIYRKAGKPDNIEITLNNIANIYQQQKMFDSALILYRESLAIARKMERTGSIAIKLGNIGTLFYDLKNYDSALFYHQQALELSQMLGRKFAVCTSYHNLGETYLAKNDLETAHKYFEKTLVCAGELQSKTILEKCYKNLSHLFEISGNPEMALEAHKKYVVFKDSVFTVKSQEKLAEMEARYQTEKKQQEIELLLKDKEIAHSALKRRRLLLYAMGSGVSILMLASIVISTLLVQKTKANQMLVRKNMELMKQEECEEMSFGSKNPLSISDEEKLRLITDLNLLMRKEKVFTQKQLTLADLAQNLGSNTAYLSHVINEHYNDTFPNFINNQRIKEAQKLFAANMHKTMTIEAIAEAVGFHSRSAFNVYFKKFTGITPSVFISNLEKDSRT